MPNQGEKSELELTVIVTVVGGQQCVRRCLTSLCSQLDFTDAEIIVPYDSSSIAVGDLSEEFPRVNFHFISDGSSPLAATKTDFEHRLYDRRRARGLSLARGRFLAITEDYAVPAQDWCKQILCVHEQPYAAIGGAIENGVDRPLNWALYYCDFGRYGRPLVSGETEYASDVNITYKRNVLNAIREVWQSAYHETTVHWTLQSLGETIFIDPRLVVFEHRPPLDFRKALRERIEWGRAFAETRVEAANTAQRIGYLVSTIILPLLLLLRVVKHMLRQRRSVSLILRSIPLVFCLLVVWSAGEFIGYLRGQTEKPAFAQNASNVLG